MIRKVGCSNNKTTFSKAVIHSTRWGHLPGAYWLALFECSLATGISGFWQVIKTWDGFLVVCFLGTGWKWASWSSLQKDVVRVRISQFLRMVSYVSCGWHRWVCTSVSPLPINLLEEFIESVWNQSKDFMTYMVKDGYHHFFGGRNEISSSCETFFEHFWIDHSKTCLYPNICLGNSDFSLLFLDVKKNKTNKPTQDSVSLEMYVYVKEPTPTNKVWTHLINTDTHGETERDFRRKTLG